MSNSYQPLNDEPDLHEQAMKEQDGVIGLPVLGSGAPTNNVEYQTEGYEPPLPQELVNASQTPPLVQTPPPPIQQPMQQSMQQPMQQSMQQPMQQSMQQPMQQPMQPMQQPIQQQFQQSMQQPIQQPMQQPMQQQFQQPIQQPIQQPMQSQHTSQKFQQPIQQVQQPMQQQTIQDQHKSQQFQQPMDHNNEFAPINPDGNEYVCEYSVVDNQAPLPDQQDENSESKSSSIAEELPSILLKSHWGTKIGSCLVQSLLCILVCSVCLFTIVVAATAAEAGAAAVGHLGWFLPISILAFIALIFACIFYVIQSCFNSTAKYLRNKQEALGTYTYVEGLRTSAPIVWAKVSCYHNETRYRTVSDGNGGTRVESYQATVVTYEETQNFKYAYWNDGSGVFRLDASLKDKTYIKLKLQKQLLFNDQQTADAYAVFAQDLQSRNRYRDHHMSFSEGMSIEGFKSSVLCRTSEKEPAWTTFTWYTVASVLLCQWPFRIAFDLISGSQKFTMYKRISLSPYMDASQSPQHADVDALLPDQ
jgi:hypothetical protein